MVIAISMTSMSGVVNAALKASPKLTPACTPSVTGNGSRNSRKPYDKVGINTNPILTCQAPTPIASSPKAASPPITTPPGNHTWNWFSFTVLLSGYSAATRGLHAASTRPFPIAITSAPANRVENPVAKILTRAPAR